MVDRARSESGFALVELLAAILLINIGILAILLSLSSGLVTLRRTAEASTSAAVADRQLERFRAMRYEDIFLSSDSLAGVDATYTGDAAYAPPLVSRACSPLVATCIPSQNVTGPDGRTYRVDTYIVQVTPVGGAPVKQVTVVVRRSSPPETLVRVVSTFGADL